MTPHATNWFPLVLKMIVVFSIVFAANVATTWYIESLDVQIWPESKEIVDRAVLAAVATYIVLMVLPFLPAIEIGLVLMTMLGPKGVLVVYACTVTALIIAFGIGRLIPAQPLIGFLVWLRLEKAATVFTEFDATPADKRLVFIAERGPAGVFPSLVRHRYWLLALLLNIPGNAVIGGGGGIAMMAGLSRLYSFPLYLLTISLGVLPGPIIILLAKSIP